MTVLLKDSSCQNPASDLPGCLVGRLGRVREGAVNLRRPACSLSFETKKYGENSVSSNHNDLIPAELGLILPHDLLKGTRLKKR